MNFFWDFFFISQSVAVVGTESDQIVSPGASSDASGVIVCVGVSAWTSGLEDFGVGCGFARLRSTKVACATIPWGVKGGASTFASYNTASCAADLEPRWAHCVQVANAPCRCALSSGSLERYHRYCQVVAIH